MPCKIKKYEYSVNMLLPHVIKFKNKKAQRNYLIEIKTRKGKFFKFKENTHWMKRKIVLNHLLNQLFECKFLFNYFKAMQKSAWIKIEM